MSGRPPRRLAHLRQPVGRLERPDQHRRRFALGLGDEVEQAVDPVGEVDVGAARRAEQDLGPLGEADVGVAGGVVALVALGLDDHAAAALVEEAAADQIAGHVVDRAVEELEAQPGLDGERRAARAQCCSAASRASTAASVSRASSICAASGSEPVPPSIRFDSSQLSRRRTS